MFEEWSLFIGFFFVFLFLGLVIYLFGNRSFRSEEGKEDTYTCGEPFKKISVRSDNFYQAIIENTGLRRLREFHTGRVSDYLLWMVVGMAIILVMILVI